MNIARVSKELERMARDNNPDIGVIWKGNDKRNLICFIRGPKDTIFEGAYFKVHCHITERYPFEPPVMIFMTKVWHPNISSVTGAICLDILKSKWTPALNISIALLSIQALLTAAEPTDPQDHEVATQYIQDHSGYEVKAKEWVQLYAKESLQTEKEKLIEYWVNRGKNRDMVNSFLATHHWYDKGMP